MEEQKHLVIRLSPQDHKWIKWSALEYDLTIKQLVLDSVQEYVDARKEKKSETV